MTINSSEIIRDANPVMGPLLSTAGPPTRVQDDDTDAGPSAGQG